MHVQVAKALGAQVAVTVRDDVKGEYVKSLGADLVINIRNEDVVEKVKAWSGGQGADVAIDNVGGEDFSQVIEAVRPFGIIVAYGFTAGAEVNFDIKDFFFTQKQLRGTIFSDPEDLEWGLEQVRTGKIKAALDRTFSTQPNC